MKKHSYLFIAMLSLVTVAACGKKDEAQQVAVVPAPVTYVMQNGSCVQSGTTTVVAASLCGQTTNGYYSNGTQCLLNGVVVGPAPCPQQTGWQQGSGWQQGWPGMPGTLPPGYTAGVGGQIGGYVSIGGVLRFEIGGSLGVGGGIGGDLMCRGQFYHPNYGWISCSGYNCSGMILGTPYGPVYCP